MAHKDLVWAERYPETYSCGPGLRGAEFTERHLRLQPWQAEWTTEQSNTRVKYVAWPVEGWYYAVRFTEWLTGCWKPENLSGNSGPFLTVMEAVDACLRQMKSDIEDLNDQTGLLE